MNIVKLTPRSKIYSLLAFVVFIVLFIFAYRHFLKWGMFAYGDMPTFPASAKDAFNAFVYSWQPDSLGNTFAQLPIMLFQAVLLFILRENTVLAQKIYILMPLPLAFISIYLFLGKYVNSQLAKFLGAFIYSVNPHTLGSGFLGGSYGMLYSHALLPLLIVFLFDMFKKDSNFIKRVNKMFIFTFFLGIAFSNSGPIIILISPVIIFLIVKLLVQRGIRILMESTLLVLSSAVLLSLLILSWLYNSIFYILPYLCPFLLKANDIVMSTPDLSIQLSVVRGAYKSQSLINILTLQWRGLNIETIWGLVIPVTAFLSLILTQNNPKNRTTLKFSIGAILVLLFLWFTHLGFTEWLFIHLPFLFNFRNTAKPSLLLSFFYATLISISIEEMIVRLRKINGKIKCLSGYFCFLALIAAIIIYNKQFFYGDMGVYQNRGRNIFVPKTFCEIGRWLDRDRKVQGFFRTLWLPWTYEGAEIKIRWIDRYTFSSILGVDQYHNSQIQDYHRFVLDSLCAGKIRNLGLMLSYANVKYVIVNLLSQESGPCRSENNYAYGSPQNFIKILDQQEDLELLIKKPDILIYRNKNFKGHITLWNGVHLFSGENLDIFNSNIFKNPLIFQKYVSSEQKDWLLGNTNVIKYHGEKDFAPSREAINCQYQINKIRETEYEVFLRTKTPVFILFSEKYHPKWEAFCEGMKLKHFPSFYGNIYYLDKIGTNHIKIIFGEQKLKDITVIITIVAWGCISIIIGYSLVKNIFCKIKSII